MRWRGAMCGWRAILLALGVGAVGTLNAQDGPPDPGHQWTIEQLGPSLCIAFLMDSAAARKRLPKAHQPVTAERFALLHPAIRRMIESEPRYATWVPATVCALSGPAITIDGRRIAGGADTTSWPMVGMWGIAGTHMGEGEGTSDSLWVLPLLFTTNNRVRRAAETGLLSIRGVDETRGTAPESTEGYYQIKIGKTRLTWVGHLAGDSAQPAAPRRSHWRLKGRRGSWWLASTVLAPAWSQPTVGSLSIEGKDDLAKALKASPIRMVGPVFWGGEGQLEFWRE